MFFADPLPQRRYGFLVGQIAGQHEGLSAMLLDVRFYLRQSCLVAGGEHHGGAHAREPEGDGLADAAGRSRDHRYLFLNGAAASGPLCFSVIRLLPRLIRCSRRFVYLSEVATVSIILPQLIGKALVFLMGSIHGRRIKAFSSNKSFPASIPSKDERLSLYCHDC